MKNSNLRFIPIVLLLLFLVVLPLTWFQEPGAFLYIHDQDMPLGTQEIVQQLFTWSDNWLGSDNGVTMFRLFPEYFLYLILYELGFTLRTSGMIIFIILFSLPAIFMYLLLKEILPHKERENDLKRELASTIGALLYSFNLYLVIIWHSGSFITAIYSYAFLPLFIRILWQLGFKKCKRPIYTAVILGLLSFVAGSALTPMLVASVIMGSGLFILLYMLITDRRYVKQLIGVTALGALIALCVNLWWFIPRFYSTVTISSLFQSAGATGLDYLGLSANVGLMDMMQLYASWAWGIGWAGRLFYSFSNTYQNWALILLCFFILVFALTILLKRKISFMVIFSAAFLLLSLFLAKGLNEPLGGIFEFLYTNVPFFYMFRTPGNKFAIGICFGLTILLSFSTYNILTRLKGLKLKLVFSSVLSLMIIAYSWPFLTGVAVVERNQGMMFDRLLNIPDFYFQAAEYINTDTDLFRVAMVPGFPFTIYKWDESEGIVGPDLLAKLIKAPSIQRSEYTTAFTYSGLISDIITAEKDFRMLGLSNTKYIILRGDIPWEYHGEPPPDIIREEIAPFVKNSKIIGPLELYEIDDKYFLPRIYLSSNTILAEGGLDEMLEVISFDSFLLDKPVFFLSEQVSLSRWQFVQEYAATQGDNYAPDITFQKVNPTKYQVRVTSATQPFFLVFSESYYPQWKAYVNPQGRGTNWLEAFFQSSIPEDKHFLVNGYANAWYIDPSELRTGAEFNITLYYQPQSLFYLGWIISGLTLAGCIGFLIWDWRRKKVADSSQLTVDRR